MILDRILSDEFISELYALGAVASETAFAIGDKTNIIIRLVELEQEKAKNGFSELRKVEQLALMELGAMDVYAFVAKKVGKASRTVRDYAMISKGFPEEARNEHIPFSHYRHAMTHPEKAKEVLELSQTQLELHGEPPSLEWLVVNTMPSHIEEAEAIQDLHKAETTMEQEPKKTATPSAYLLLVQIDRVVSMLEKAFDRIEVDEAQRNVVLQKARELSHELQSIYGKQKTEDLPRHLFIDFDDKDFDLDKAVNNFLGVNQ